MKKLTWAEFREQERAKALKWMFYILYPLALFLLLFLYYVRWASLRWLVVILMGANLVAVGICLGAIGVHIIRFSETLKTDSKRIGIYIPGFDNCVFLSISGGITEEQVSQLTAHIYAQADKYFADVKTMDGFDIYDAVNPWMEEHGLKFEADFNYEDYRIYIPTDEERT